MYSILSLCLSLSVTWRSSVGGGGVRRFGLARCVAVRGAPDVHISSSTVSETSTLNNQTSNDQTLNNQTLNDQTLNNQTLNNQTLNNQTLND